MTVLHIKNMVCPRCIMAVRALLEQQGLRERSVVLGEAVVDDDLSEDQRTRLKRDLEDLGFELLDDPRSETVEQVRTMVLQWVDLKGERPKLSAFLHERLRKDYPQLSKLFSEVRGMTIERYAILQRVERAKELLCYSGKTTSEIAWQLGFSSHAHLSAQFRQVTGMSPKEFKQQNLHASAVQRRSLDEI